MEAGDSILDAIDEELSFEDGVDVEMMDIEEGEFIDGLVPGHSSGGNENDVNTKPSSEHPQCTTNMSKSKKKKKKNKNRKKKGTGGSNVVDIDRFVLGVCRHLREKKSYLVYSAVGSLGVSALSDLVKEVDAVQACGGQKTAHGDRFRSPGGVLWNILKVRDPNAYKEIMKKGKEFEKQFRRPSAVQASSVKISKSAQGPPDIVSSKTSPSTSDNDAETKMVPDQEQLAQPSSGDREKRRSVQDRLRRPVSYDDLLVKEPLKD